MIHHRHRYKIIGTGFIRDMKTIQCDLICPKCGKKGTVYVNEKFEDRIIHQASKGKYFRIPIDFVLTEKEWKSLLENWKK